MLKKIIPLVVLAVVLTACGGATPSTNLTLELSDFAYDQTSITIPAGQPVQITLVNKGLVEHDFVIEQIDADVVLKQDSGTEAHQMHGQEEEFAVHASAQTGETTILEITVYEAGTYEIFCSVEGHKEAGMISELIVVPAEQ
jgi:uncharacterized cupredoxin-like copper-binding protein